MPRKPRASVGANRLVTQRTNRFVQMHNSPNRERYFASSPPNNAAMIITTTATNMDMRQAITAVTHIITAVGRIMVAAITVTKQFWSELLKNLRRSRILASGVGRPLYSDWRAVSRTMMSATSISRANENLIFAGNSSTSAADDLQPAIRNMSFYSFSMRLDKDINRGSRYADQ
jgi:hypothetical protein